MTEYEYAVQVSTGEYYTDENDYNARCDVLTTCIDRMLVDPEDCVGVATGKECDWQVTLTDELELIARFVFVFRSYAKKVDVDKKKLKSYFTGDFDKCTVTKKLVSKTAHNESLSDSIAADS